MNCIFSVTGVLAQGAGYTLDWFVLASGGAYTLTGGDLPAAAPEPVTSKLYLPARMR